MTTVYLVHEEVYESTYHLLWAHLSLVVQSSSIVRTKAVLFPIGFKFCPLQPLLLLRTTRRYTPNPVPQQGKAQQRQAGGQTGRHPSASGACTRLASWHHVVSVSLVPATIHACGRLSRYEVQEVPYVLVVSPHYLYY